MFNYSHLALSASILLLSACGPAQEGLDTGLQEEDHSSEGLAPGYGSQPEFCSNPEVSIQAAELWEVTGEHYLLSVGRSWSETEAETFGVLLESAWPALEHYFGSSAKGLEDLPLEVFFFDSEADWADAIEADGIVVPWGAGGLFHPSTNRAYLWRQPEEYTNRMLLLHEVAHQFHHLATDSQARTSWFVEGLAGYLQRHDWYDGCLRMGVVPTGTLEDSHAQALENWEAGNLDLESFVAGEGFNRPDSLALWAYLEEEHTEAFRDFRDEIDGGLSTEAEAFADILSSPLSHEESYEQWLMVHQEPLAVVYTGWLHLDQLHIAADVSGTDTLVFAPLKEAPASFSMRVLPQESFFSAGPMTSFDDWDHWSVVIAEPSGAVYALLYGDTGGAWQTLASIEASAELQISYAVTDQATELQLNGEQQLFSHEQTGSAGLGVYNSSVIFELDW